MWKGICLTAIAASALLGAAATLARPAAAQGAVHEAADFNGDGFKDLAIGVPGEGYFHPIPDSPQHLAAAGVVQVTFGQPGGLSWARNTLLSRAAELPSSIDAPSANANFGAALAWADFNRDGYDDLAIGSPGDLDGRGAVDVYFGSKEGFKDRPDQIIRRWDVEGVDGDRYDRFGCVLAAGDIDGDGYPELAISRQYGSDGTGAVWVLNGSSNGLQTSNAEELHYFGVYGPFAMTFGDFNGDGFFDLAMGLPYAYQKGYSWLFAGAVLVDYGSPYGLSRSPQFWSQDSPGIAGIVEAGDQFGASLAAADFNRDGCWDLAVGSPGENESSGIAHVIFGTFKGLDGAGSQIWSQDNPGVQDEVERDDQFGFSLTAAHLNGDGYPELVVGAPGENESAGAVHVLTIVAGPFGPGHQFWTQDSGGVLGACEPDDRFGSALAAGDFDGGGAADLAIGVRGEDKSAGAVNVLLGRLTGLTGSNSQILFQGFEALPDVAEPGDTFGVL